MENKIKAMLLKMLERREYSFQEAKKKLLGRFTEEESLVSEILSDFESRDLISDMRFAEDFVTHQLIITKNGPYKISQQLQAKGISKEISRTVLCKIFTKELQEQRLSGLMKQRLSILAQPITYQDKEKLFRFLSNKGYESHMIYSCLDDVG